MCLDEPKQSVCMILGVRDNNSVIETYWGVFLLIIKPVYNQPIRIGPSL